MGGNQREEALSRTQLKSAVPPEWVFSAAVAHAPPVHKGWGWGVV